MSIETVIKCDVCGKQKQQTNHWFLLETGQVSLTIWQWEKLTRPDNYKHICGQECAVKALSEWMQKRAQ